MLKSIHLIGILIWALSYFVYKLIDHYAFSMTKFRETRLGKKYLPAIESSIASAAKRTASWEVKEKLAAVKKACENVALYSLVLFLILALFCGIFNLLNRVTEIALVLLIVMCLLASAGKFCFEWTLNHKQVIKEAATYFAIVLSLSYLSFVLFFILSSSKGAAIGSQQFGQLVSITIVMALMLALALGVLYAGTWLILGAPVALSGITVWVASRSAAFLVRRYSEETLIYVVTVARIVSWSAPLITILLSLILTWFGVGSPFLLTEATK
jgi:hypothetical protein